MGQLIKILMDSRVMFVWVMLIQLLIIKVAGPVLIGVYAAMTVVGVSVSLAAQFGKDYW